MDATRVAPLRRAGLIASLWELRDKLTQLRHLRRVGEAPRAGWSPLTLGSPRRLGPRGPITVVRR